MNGSSRVRWIGSLGLIAALWTTTSRGQLDQPSEEDQALHSASYELRVAIAKRLKDRGPDAVPLLAKMVRDPHPFVREAAAESLTAIGPAAKEAIPALVEASRNRDDWGGYRSLLAIAAIDPQSGRIVPGLVEMLQSPNPWIRIDAAGELRRRDPNRSRDALNTLIQMIHFCREHKDHTWMDTTIRSIAEFGARGAPAVPVLIGFLKDEESRTRKAAVDALAEIGPVTGDVVPSLVAVLKDDDPNVRQAAIAALGKIGPPAKSAIPALVKMLDDRSLPGDYENGRIYDARTFVLKEIAKIDPGEAAWIERKPYVIAGAVAAGLVGIIGLVLVIRRRLRRRTSHTAT